MGFLGFRKATGIHSRDSVERLTAVHQLGNAQQRQLAALACEDSDPQVRLAATRRLRDQGTLDRLIHDSDPAIAEAARQGLVSDAARRLKSCSWAEGSHLLPLVMEGSPLAELVLEASDPQVRKAAAERLFAQTEPAAQALLTIAVQDSEGTFAMQALERMENRKDLKQVVKRARNPGVQKAAEERVEAQRAEQKRPSALQRRQQRRQALAPLVEQAAILALSCDWNTAQAGMQAIQAEAAPWLNEDDLCDEDRDFEQRLQRSAELLQQRQEKESAAIAACKRFLEQEPDPSDGAACEHWQQLWQAIEAEDVRQGFALSWPPKQAPSLAEAEEMSSEHSENAVLESAPEIDQEALDALNREAAELAEAEDMRSANVHFQGLHKRWLQIVGPLPSDDPRQADFQNSWNHLKQRRRDERERREQEQQQRLAKLQQLLAQMQTLPEHAQENPQHSLAERRRLQDAWRAVGAVPARLLGDLRKGFQEASQAVDTALEEWYQQRDWERFAQVAVAEELIREAGTLAEQAEQSADNGEELFQRTRALQTRWKEMDPLPQARSDQLWQQFREACDRIFTCLEPWFAQRDAERLENLKERERLIERLSVLVEDESQVGLPGSAADQDHRQRCREQVAELNSAWKACGPVPREQRRDIEQRWKKLLDRWYQGLCQQRAQEDAERAENTPLKEALIAHLQGLLRDAEAVDQGLLPGRTLDQVLEKLRQARREWRNIGFVPKADLARLRNEWNRLNEALDAALADRLAEEHAQEAANGERKQALCDEFEQLLGEERPEWFRDEAIRLRKAWQDIGRVPRSALASLESRWRDLNQRFEDSTRSDEP